MKTNKFFLLLVFMCLSMAFKANAATITLRINTYPFSCCTNPCISYMNCVTPPSLVTICWAFPLCNEVTYDPSLACSPIVCSLTALDGVTMVNFALTGSSGVKTYNDSNGDPWEIDWAVNSFGDIDLHFTAA